MSSSPIAEDDLNAFVDHALEPRRHAEVAAYLDAHPDVAQRIAVYSSHREQLRLALAPIAEEPVPPELNVSRLIRGHRSTRWMQAWARAVAAALLLSAGAAGGWVLRDLSMPSSLSLNDIAQQAADSYFVYANERVHPVEIRAEDRAALADWAEKQLRHRIVIPDLTPSGYRFMGGRVVPTNHGPAAMFMYDDDNGTRLVMVAHPMVSDLENAPMSPYSKGDVNGYAWSDNGLGYSLVGPLEASVLHPTAKEARRQLKNNV